MATDSTVMSPTETAPASAILRPTSYSGSRTAPRAHCDATGEATDLNVLQHLVASDNKPRGNNIAATSSALNTALESSSSHCRVCSLRDAFDDAIAAPS